MPTLNEQTKAQLPLTMLFAAAVSLVTGTAASTARVYAFRDQVLDNVDTRLKVMRVEVAEGRKEALTGYLSKLEWSEWKQEDRVRQDRQYYSLLRAIEKMSEKLGR